MKISGAFAVSIGVFGSRVLGFIRESVFAHYFGNSDAADAFRASLKIPNLLQNLFGEGVLSASFIPVYTRLRSEGREEEASIAARSVLLLLCLLSSLVAVIGIATAPLLVSVITPGFTGEKRELTILLTRILFPGTALLVISAWCLGVQNSHRKFLLSYSAPILWNIAIICSLFLCSGSVSLVAWGVVAGSTLQLLVQLPLSLRLLGRLLGRVEIAGSYVSQVLRNFAPVLLSRGVVQISAFVDSIIASLISAGSLAVLSYAQVLYLLPISLFGVSVSAAELPELSENRSSELLLKRLQTAAQRILVFVFPSTAAFILIGDRVIASVFQSGQFQGEDTFRVWQALALLSIALPAVTLSRLFNSFFYSQNRAGELLKISLIRVACSGTLGALLAITFECGLNGLCAAAALAGYLELFLLIFLFSRDGRPLPNLDRGVFLLALWALIAGIGARFLSDGLGRLPGGVVAVGAFGVLYLPALFVLRRRILHFGPVAKLPYKLE
jgi:putative peptidoglycan lipid II flippase